jgi:uncharacterized membrane protein
MAISLPVSHACVRSTAVRIVLALTALAALLRFTTLDVQSFASDESVTAGEILNIDFLGMLRKILGWESTLPLYYVLAWFWSKLFGTGEVMRSLSALFGVATVPVAYVLGATLVTRRVGTILAALVAVNPMLVWYSQEARAYALLVLMSTLSLLFVAQALEHPSRRRLALWALSSALALGSHYFALFLLLPESVWLLARARRQFSRESRRDTVLAVVAAAAAGLLLAPLALYQAAERRQAGLPRLTSASA